MKKFKRIMAIVSITCLAIIGSCSKETSESNEITKLNVSPQSRLYQNDVIGELDANNNWVITTNLTTRYSEFEAIAAEAGVTAHYASARIKVSNSRGDLYALYLYDSSGVIGASQLVITGRIAKLGVTDNNLYHNRLCNVYRL